MKRLLISYFISFCFFVTSAQKLESTLNYFKEGYIVYGFNKIKESVISKNDVWAQFFLAQCYEYGYGTDANYFEAFKYYKKSAERGLLIAQYALSVCYANGIGVNVNLQKAGYWREKTQGNVNYDYLDYLGLLYNEGIKHPENYALNPNGGSYGQSNDNLLAIQNNGNINSNNHTINNITIIQGSVPTQPSSSPVQTKQKSGVDINIPSSSQNNENTFALIIANENYQDVTKVPNALNDGEIFAEYCKKTLGLPSSNVVLVKDATYNNIKREINKLSQIANAYNGSAKIVFYYAGHGVPNEATKDAFLLPVDGYGTDTSTGYSLKELYAILGQLPAEQVVVLLDACFSGSQRGEGMLASARGVAIKAKPNKVDGKMVILSAAQGDETAYPYEEQGHGLFTYYLLKKIQETNGNVSLGDLAAYIKDNVSKKSIVVNGKPQTPSVSPSAILGETWKNWKLY